MDFKKQNFNTEIGQKVKVERHEVKNETAERGNAELRQIGERFNPYPQAMQYKGSMCVHVYQSEILGHIMFAAQNLIQDIPEETASAALSDLRGSAQEFYGRNRQVKRSGF